MGRNRNQESRGVAIANNPKPITGKDISPQQKPSQPRPKPEPNK